MLDFEITQDMIDALPEADRPQWREFLRQREAKRAARLRAIEAHDWDTALRLSSSQHRAPVLAAASLIVDDAEARRLVEEWWSVTEAWSGDDELREGMYALIHKAAADGPVIVTADGEDPPEFTGVLRVYQGNLGEEPYHACGSWTLDISVAERFGLMAAGPRGRLVLGMNQDGTGVPSVWQADVWADDILGYFNDRGEQEIVVERHMLAKLIRQATRKEETCS